MVTNYDLVPNDSNVNAGVRCYGDSLEPLPHNQQRPADTVNVIEAGSPVTQSDGIGPPAVTFRGRWLGSKASDLADRLRTIANDPGTTELDVQGKDEQGNDVSTPYNHVHVIAGEITIEQVVPGNDAAWRYAIPLSRK